MYEKKAKKLLKIPSALRRQPEKVGFELKV